MKRSRLKRVVLCKNLSFAGQLRNAIPEYGSHTLYLEISRGAHSKLYLRKVIHHEFFHVIDYRDDGRVYLDERWAALNPATFKYGSGGKSAQGLTETSTLTDKYPGFLNHYSTTGVEEDKAEIFANLIVDPAYVESRARKDRVLKAKVERMKDLLIGFCPEMKEEFFQAGVVAGQSHSELWGKAGEEWRPDGRLPDFSYAGYHCGEEEIPRAAEVANVKAFGAKGDGEQDDTRAFLDAIEGAESGAIYVPPGRYKITDIVRIQKSNVVLRGAGPDQSVLVFPRPLNDILPNWGSTTGGRRTSNYSWSGGLVRVEGNFRSERLADVTLDAKRGDTVLRVSSTKALRVGQRVEVFVRDDEQKTLTDTLYSGDPGDTRKFSGAKGSFVVTLTGLKHHEIVFDRPLRFDVKLGWKPEIRRFAPTVTEVGIEDLCFEFPLVEYDGHFTELGHNAIAMSSVADCWVRNVKILNADSGLFVNAKFCTVSGVTFESRRPAKGGCSGHHGVLLGGTDNLFTSFRFDTCFIHDLGVSANDAGNVFSNGSGVDVNFDHHKRAPYENLFTNIDVGRGTRMWHSGGGRSLGRHCGARGTFWNIRAERSQRHPGEFFGPASMNVVAVETDQPSEKNLTGRWLEAIDPSQVDPQNLHEAQLARRLAEKRGSEEKKADTREGQ